MPIRFFCGKCKFRLRTPDGSGGMTVDCSRCGASQKVPPATDPEAEKASANRRAFLAEIQSEVALPSAETKAAYEEPPIELVVDDREETYVKSNVEYHYDDDDEGEDDVDSVTYSEDDEAQNSALTQLGQALIPPPPKPLPDIKTALSETITPKQAQAEQALAGLAKQVRGAPTPPTPPNRPTPSRPQGRPGQRPGGKKAPQSLHSEQVLRPAPPAPSVPVVVRRKRVPPSMILACRIAGMLGIPAAVKVGLVVKDAAGDGWAGLAVAMVVIMLSVTVFALGEICDAQ